MRRIFSEHAYGAGPRNTCWWDETIAAPLWDVPTGEIKVDVAIVGGGFTGISAALHLANTGTQTAVLEANTPGWGASGRNGGFCCLGGARICDSALARAYGEADAKAYRKAERDAVALVTDLLSQHGIDADVHSNGETLLAHTRGHFAAMEKDAAALGAKWNCNIDVIAKRDLAANGMGGPFHGATTLPIGFGLNPRKYLFGIATAAKAMGAKLFQNSPVHKIARQDGRYCLATNLGTVRADAVIIATNGYSSEDVPDWMAGRYLPAQSNVLVTRPLSEAELASQGWTTSQMSYDSRHLLHYFRLMPDNRFLFGMRGGLATHPAAQARARARVRRDFETMFPGWRQVETAHSWSGMICLTRKATPFAGPVPGRPGLFAGFAYHGNGVAMGSYTGRALARSVLGQPTGLPKAMTATPPKFPFGSARRVLMPPLYLGLTLADALGW